MPAASASASTCNRAVCLQGAAQALGLAASGLAEAIDATVAAGRRELALVAALDRIVAPPNRIAVEKLG